MAGASLIETYKFQINRDNFEKILKCVADLSKINPMVKLKLDEEHVLFYSRAGNDMTIPAFKSFQYDLSDFMTVDEPKILDFIILNGSNFVKNCSLFLDKEEDIMVKLDYNKQAKVANQMSMSNGKLEFNFISGDYTQIKDITKNQIEERMDPSLSNFSFEMDKQQFTELKKLVTLNKSEVINIKISKGKLFFFDKRWKLHITEIKSDDDFFTFSSKYLKSIDGSCDSITINMFDHFLLIKEGNTNLMIGLELSKI